MKTLHIIQHANKHLFIKIFCTIKNEYISQFTYKEIHKTFTSYEMVVLSQYVIEIIDKLQKLKLIIIFLIYITNNFKFIKFRKYTGNCLQYKLLLQLYFIM